jgi:hypothetical protein
MDITNSFWCVYNNLVSNFYIIVNLFLPYYGEDILKIQYKTIECINENIIFECNARKRKRFNIFVENLIVKNNELIEKIKQQEEQDNNLDNYEHIKDTQDDSEESCSTEEPDEDIQEDTKED